MRAQAGGMKIIMVFLFLCSIAAANYAVSELPPVGVWFGIMAPAGVYLVALTLVLRDLVQRLSGVWGLVCAGVGGIALSFVLADAEVVWASCAAFAVSFLIDTAVFSLVCRRTNALWIPVIVSGLVSIVPDTYIFLHLAGLEQFIPGQLIGKAYGTIAYAMIVGLFDWKVQASVPAHRE